jgi:hypothetical protein
MIRVQTGIRSVTVDHFGVSESSSWPPISSDSIFVGDSIVFLHQRTFWLCLTTKCFFALSNESPVVNSIFTKLLEA